LGGKQAKSGQDNPDQENVDVENEALVDGFVCGLEFQDIDVEKSAEAAGENILFGFVNHIQWRLQKEQEKDEVSVFDKSEKKDKEENGDEKACLCPIAFKPMKVCCQGHFMFLSCG